jgi:hypothetical protein
MASTSAQTEKKSDPIVLGVSVPLNLTLTAVKQVADAWQKFGLDFAEAVTHIRETKAASSKSEKQTAGESSAAAAAGVSA